VSSLCSSSCVSEYDATTQSIKLTMQNGRLAMSNRKHWEVIQRGCWGNVGHFAKFLVPCFSKFGPGRDPVQTVRVLSWFPQRMTCVVARNYAQPIPHHASPNSIVVWEIRFHGEKDHHFSSELLMLLHAVRQ
jgi:hypothetical protein